MDIRNAALLLCFICAMIHKCLTETSLFEEVSKLPTFVDKTHLLRFLFTKEDNASSTIILTCPKGFGNTVNLDMIRRFAKIYPNQTERNRTRDLFKKLKIGQDEEFFSKHFGKYAIVSMDFDTPTTANTCDEILDVLHNATKRSISEYEWLYEQHLKNTENSTGSWKAVNLLFEDALYGKPPFWKLGHYPHYEHGRGIYWLCEAINTFYSENVIVLADEYDSPIMRATSTGDSHCIDMVAVNQYMMFEHNYRGQQKWAYKFVTGIVNGITNRSEPDDSSVESGEDLLENDLRKFKFLDNHHFSEFCGFTENEMENIFNHPKTRVTKEEKLMLKNCYNGYVSDANSIRIYNPFYLHADIMETKNTDPHQKIVKCKGLRRNDTIMMDEQFIRAYLKNEYILSTIANLVRNRPFTFRKLDNLVQWHLQELNHVTIRTNEEPWVPISESAFDIFFSLLFQYGYLTKVNNFPSFENKTWYKAPNDHVTSNLGGILTRYLNSYPNPEALIDVAKIFSNIFSNDLKIQNAEEALIKVLAELFEPVYEIADVIDHEFSFHSQMYTSVLYGCWIRKFYHMVDGHARIDRVEKIDRNYRRSHRHPSKVNILMKSLDNKSFLLVEMESDAIFHLGKAEQLDSNLTYKSSLILHEQHPQKLPERLLFLIIKPLQNQTVHVKFLPSLHLVENTRIRVNTDTLAIYEEAASCH